MENRRLGQWGNTTEAKQSGHGGSIGGRLNSGNRRSKCRDKHGYNKIRPTLGCGSGSSRSDRQKANTRGCQNRSLGIELAKDKPGMLPSTAAFCKLVEKLAAGISSRIEACNCSAASACLTAVTMEAKKAGEGWSRVRDWDVAGGWDELLLSKLEFAANVSMSTGEIMAWNAATWLLHVDLDVIILAISFPTKTKGNKRQ